MTESLAHDPSSSSEHAVSMGGILGVANFLQYVPMLHGFAVDVHLVEINARDSPMLGAVVK